MNLAVRWWCFVRQLLSGHGVISACEDWMRGNAAERPRSTLARIGGYGGLEGTHLEGRWTRLVYLLVRWLVRRPEGPFEGWKAVGRRQNSWEATLVKPTIEDAFGHLAVAIAETLETICKQLVDQGHLNRELLISDLAETYESLQQRNVFEAAVIIPQALASLLAASSPK
jgi:hypothetical protein